jgi:hypothetical protein
VVDPQIRFLLLIFYWLLSKAAWQNRLLLAASYIFYATFNPWFCLLLASSTLVDYYAALGMVGSPARKKVYLGLSLAVNLGMLGYFKYCNFFISSFSGLLNLLGIDQDEFGNEVAAGESTLYDLQNNIPLVDFSNDAPLKASYFSDPIHMNKAGQAVFTRMAVEALQPLIK